MSAVVPDFGDEPTCTCGDEADDHVFTGGGFCNLCDCERYRPTRPLPPAELRTEGERP